MCEDDLKDSLHEKAYVIPLGFAIAVTMWAVAYVCRLPAVMAPGWVLLSLMLFSAAAWGRKAGRCTDGGVKAGLAGGAFAAVLNLMILGSLLSTDGTLMTLALLWIPGSILAISAVSGLAAATAGKRCEKRTDWTALFSKVAVAATFLLLIAGGLVTSYEAGLSVVDWPNSFGYNMFLYPLTRMTGGIYYEHAHRLFGSLVGLTTVFLCIRLSRVGVDRRVKILSGITLILVIVQGLLGGLRVTGHFTLSTTIGDMTPSIVLAIVHGVFGQVVFALIVALAVLTSRLWRSGPKKIGVKGLDVDHILQNALLVTLLVQLVFGAIQRHIAWGIIIHVSFAGVVWMVASVSGARAWWLRSEISPVNTLGKTLLIVVSVQVTLGIAALVATGGEAVVGSPSMIAVSLATAHQACGALLLSVAVALPLWTRKLLTEAQ